MANNNSNISTKIPILPAAFLLLVIIVGTIGYYILWYDTHSTFIDALYMTLITIMTIGYKEVYPLNDAGRIFTIIIGIGGIGSLFYMLTIFMENLFIIQLQNYQGKKKIMKRLKGLENHLILAGHGRVGKLAAKEIAHHNQQCVIIDGIFEDDISNNVKEQIFKLRGDATQDEILLKAGIKKAKSMIVATAIENSATLITADEKILLWNQLHQKIDARL